MGWGVRAEDTYGQQLEKLLNEEDSGDLRFEVINAGVPGWNLENDLAYLQGEGLKYEPDLILLDLTLANDIKGKSSLLADNYPPLIKWLRTNTYLWPFLALQLRWLEARADGRDRIDVLDPPTNPDKYFPPDPESEQWTNFWNQVLAINQVASQKAAGCRAATRRPITSPKAIRCGPKIFHQVSFAGTITANYKFVPTRSIFCPELPGCLVDDAKNALPRFDVDSHIYTHQGRTYVWQGSQNRFDHRNARDLMQFVVGQNHWQGAGVTSKDHPDGIS